VRSSTMLQCHGIGGYRPARAAMGGRSKGSGPFSLRRIELGTTGRRRRIKSRPQDGTPLRRSVADPTSFGRRCVKGGHENAGISLKASHSCILVEAGAVQEAARGVIAAEALKLAGETFDLSVRRPETGRAEQDSQCLVRR
jgi:hypothetical protein